MFQTSKTNDSVNWRCSVRTVKIKCPATVKQLGDHLKAGNAEHIHPADLGRKLKAEVTTKVSNRVFKVLSDKCQNVKCM